MNLSNIIKFLLCLSVIIFWSCNSSKEKVSTNDKLKNYASIKTPKKPNILVILCDDLGYSDVGFNGSKEIPTPGLDQLANEGTILTSAYVSHPFCGPSRASLMTGRYAHKIGAQFNLPPNSGETIKKGISLEETFISKVLDNAGYNTGIIGKWHLGSNPEFHPNVRGFDDFFGFLGGGHNYFPDQYRAAYKRQKESGQKIIWDYLHPLEYNGKQIKETEYLTDAFSREAVRFIKKSGKTKNPFFLYLSYNAPHTPLEAKEEDLKLFSHIKDKKRRTYAAMVYAVDRGVKRVTKALKESGQYENTLIVFFSDNGGKVKAGANNYPLKDGKGSTFEGGYRVPMFFHWPNVVPAGQKFNYNVSALDFYPTFAKLAGAKIPDNKQLDGKDIWNNFLQNKDPRKDENIYVMRHRNGYSDVGVRKNEWKAVKAYNKKWQLFNVDKDRAEKNNLRSQHPEILKNLVKEAQVWSKTHIQPNWWHDNKTGLQWKKDKMPRFDETFSLQ